MLNLKESDLFTLGYAEHIFFYKNKYCSMKDRRDFRAFIQHGVLVR